MAIDEYLISYYGKTKTPVLRVYGWSRPAISLGRYQRPDCLLMDSCRRDRVDIVRRMTGGGAIFHDREVTYSIVCSARDLGGGEHSVMQSFERLNGMFLDMYKEFGLTARFAGTSPEPGMPDRISQFCFSGREKYDILMDNRKIGGNAQRRTGGVVFQHGSVPLDVDTAGIQKYFRDRIDGSRFTCLRQTLGREVAYDEVVEKLAAAFSKMLGARLAARNIDSGETAAIGRILEQKYMRYGWNLGARPEEHSNIPAEAV
jgi:lipoate-protein ligase A